MRFRRSPRPALSCPAMVPHQRSFTMITPASLILWAAWGGFLIAAMNNQNEPLIALLSLTLVFHLLSLFRNSAALQRMALWDASHTGPWNESSGTFSLTWRLAPPGYRWRRRNGEIVLRICWWNHIPFIRLLVKGPAATPRYTVKMNRQLRHVFFSPSENGVMVAHTQWEHAPGKPGVYDWPDIAISTRWPSFMVVSWYTFRMPFRAVLPPEPKPDRLAQAESDARRSSSPRQTPSALLDAPGTPFETRPWRPEDSGNKWNWRATWRRNQLMSSVSEPETRPAISIVWPPSVSPERAASHVQNRLAFAVKDSVMFRMLSSRTRSSFGEGAHHARKAWEIIAPAMWPKKPWSCAQASWVMPSGPPS